MGPSGRGRGRRAGRRRVLAAVTAAALVATGCSDPGTDPGSDPSTRPSTDAPAAPAAPTTPAAPAAPAAPGPRPLEDIYPDLDWPFEADQERIVAFPAELDAAFDQGAEAGFRFLAEHSWPDGFTADALLACRTPEPTATYAELDAQGFRYRFELLPPLPVPGFVYPPTGEYPADLGLRPYLTMLSVLTQRTDEETGVSKNPTRFALTPDDRIVMFPACFEYLPGQFLAHRVTDGHVGGYTAAEAEGDVRLIFTSSPAAAQEEVCRLLGAGDVATIARMIVPPDLASSGMSVPRDVLEATLVTLCAARAP